MMAALAAGAGVGVGLLLTGRALMPPRQPLGEALARIDTAARYATRAETFVPRGANAAARRHDALRWAVGDRLAAVWVARGWLNHSLRSDLALLECTSPDFFARKAVYGVVGLVLPPTLVAVLGFGGVRVPVILPAWGALLVAALFFTFPDLGVRSDATRRRRDFRVVVGSFLDLVAMKMASGSGLAEALREAAAVGHGWAFARLRGALEDARIDGLSPAAALGRLGEELGLPDLRDLSASLTLVDTSGAQAEESLRTKASSLRARELSEAVGAANERSQAMLVAQVLLGLGFLLFLGYPAVARVLAS